MNVARVVAAVVGTVLALVMSSSPVVAGSRSQSGSFNPAAQLDISQVERGGWIETVPWGERYADEANQDDAAAAAR